MANPYDVLGVNPQDSDETIKKAYRKLAKKYHPDNFVGSQYAESASEKMKEINGAYDEIMSLRAGNQSSGGSAQFSADFRRIRELINSGRGTEADILLSRVEDSKRGAEWHFLKGCVALQKGWLLDARSLFEKACRMDPANSEYRQALNNLSQSNYRQSTGGTASTESCGVCPVCSTLLCMDCCCEACGGDCIRCC